MYGSRIGKTWILSVNRSYARKTVLYAHMNLSDNERIKTYILSFDKERDCQPLSRCSKGSIEYMTRQSCRVGIMFCIWIPTKRQSQTIILLRVVSILLIYFHLCVGVFTVACTGAFTIQERWGNKRRAEGRGGKEDMCVAKRREKGNSKEREGGGRRQSLTVLGRDAPPMMSQSVHSGVLTGPRCTVSEEQEGQDQRTVEQCEGRGTRGRKTAQGGVGGRQRRSTSGRLLLVLWHVSLEHCSGVERRDLPENA